MDGLIPSKWDFTPFIVSFIHVSYTLTYDTNLWMSSNSILVKYGRRRNRQMEIQLKRVSPQSKKDNVRSDNWEEWHTQRLDS